ncbi:hypothetical protein OYE22_14815 [Streptomyces sp. 71268]|nr:hypothetical protein [Streptomyces sp. 71268]WEV26328.1 hypothetical protein OYE22_14815 [Streptomyces sp. 71268]
MTDRAPWTAQRARVLRGRAGHWHMPSPDLAPGTVPLPPYDARALAR